MVLLAIGFGILLGIAHFFSDRIDFSKFKEKMKLISFTSGILLTYLFLDLFPQFYGDSRLVVDMSLLFVLIGFSMFHFIEKYIERRSMKRSEIRKELKRVHSAAFFLYHLAIGIIIVDLTGSSAIKGFLFFIPIMLYSVTSTISMKEIDGQVRESGPVKALLSVSTLLGTAITLFVKVEVLVFDMLIGFIAGSLLYIVVMDSIQKEKGGQPAYFMLGIIAYVAAIVGLRLILA
ncbi:MAG: hypothetical protein HY518_04735 [Candidatus Aenigmarchaeota archaeon]|nr:hypothetical protein [Candidatus Aenigmarchaeota archaeon]